MATFSEYKILYVSHFNWSWVVDVAIEDCRSDLVFSTVKASSKNICVNISSDVIDDNQAQDTSKSIHSLITLSKLSRFRDLPSQIFTTSTRKPPYSLFRIEITNQSRLISLAWVDSPIFEFLDPKDALFRHLQQTCNENFMPETSLIPSDISTTLDLLAILNNSKFLETQESNHDENNIKFKDKFLLKAALGSGGFGLYFVDNVDAVLEVIKGHAERAAKFPGFTDGLKQKYGGHVPYWSLQRLILPVRTRINASNRKTQVRAYVISCNDKMFIYKNFEVRVPYWGEESLSNDDDDDDDTAPPISSQAPGQLLHALKKTWSHEVENEFVGKGDARPYNECRRKADTERLMINEIPELVDAHGTIEAVVLSSMHALKPAMEAHLDLTRSSASSPPSRADCIKTYESGVIKTTEDSVVCDGIMSSSMAIAGIDLVVEYKASAEGKGKYSAYIVEFNNNPAMPDGTKKMSECYRSHLVSFVGGLMELGLSALDSDSAKNSEDIFQRIW